MTTQHFSDPRVEDLSQGTYKMTVVGQDPAIRAGDGKPLYARVRVPSDRIQAGPHSHRFRVVDIDGSRGVETQPAPVSGSGWDYQDPFADAYPDAAVIVADDDVGRQFRCQNVYAIASRTLAVFEAALGRRVPWGFGGHELFIVPHAFAEANAYYARDDHALYFGYTADANGAPVFTCLSHDIVAHETAHALVDGLRPGFMYPGFADQAAFHEAIADIVALLSVFSMQEIVEHLLGKADRSGQISTSKLTREALQKNAVFKLAEQLGDVLADSRGDGLRRSVALEFPWEGWKEEDSAFTEPHRRGEVLVAAVMRTLLDIWVDRLEPLVRDGRPRADRERAAEEGAKSAKHLLRMMVRAIDYLPPTEFEFDDFITAALNSDAEVAPHDDRGYRARLEASFAGYGIKPVPQEVHDLSAQALRYTNVNLEALRRRRDEVSRFIWGNSARLGVVPGEDLRVTQVEPSVRFGPDGLIVTETIATYVQELSGRISELGELSRREGGRRILTEHPGLKPDTEVMIRGSGTIIFDQFGKLKYQHSKPLFDWDRQQKRLRFLASSGLLDTRRRVGFSTGTSRGRRFAEMHVPVSRAREDW